MVRLYRLACLALVVAFAATPASATTLSVDTGKSLTLQPGTSGTLTLSITNDAGAITNNFAGWVLGLQLVPAVSTTGSIGYGTLANAAVNPAIPRSGSDIEASNESAAFPAGTTINGLNSFQSLAIANLVDATTLLGSTSYNLGDLQITSSGDASGVWNVFAINLPSADGTKSYWFDAAFGENNYGNIAVPTTGNTTSVLLGTVTVTAVPEPGSLALAAFGAGGVLAAMARRRRVRATA